MASEFKTIKPYIPEIAQYVDYYYLDIKPYNEVTEFTCFPHFNNSVSLYSSHIRNIEPNEVIYNENAAPLQIFTPIREKTMQIRQIGKVHRIVIVFTPFGINQFFKEINFGTINASYSYFSTNEISALFATTDIEEIGHKLDKYLSVRLTPIRILPIEKTVEYIFANFEDFSVEKWAEELKISRRHLNRIFKINIGVSLKRFHEIVLFRKAIMKKLFDNPTMKFTDLAYTLNYSDQAHLIKTFKKFTSNSPKSFFEKGVLLGNEDTFWHINT